MNNQTVIGHLRMAIEALQRGYGVDCRQEIILALQSLDATEDSADLEFRKMEENEETMINRSIGYADSIKFALGALGRLMKDVK